MKTIKQISKILLASVIITTFVNSSFAQERKESLEKSFQINSTGYFSFSCYDTDLKINTWQKDEVKLTGEIIIEGGDKEDQDKLIELFRNPKVGQSSNSLNIETNMSSGTIYIGPFMTITLVNGKKIKVKKFKVTYTIWVPESINFKLKSKYNNVDIAYLTGDVNFDLHDVDLTLLGFGKEAKFDMKYSTATIGKGGNSNMEIYDCEIEALEMNNVKIKSKYSEIDIVSLNTLNFDSYDDDITIEKIRSLKTVAKYSDYKIGSDMTNCNIAFYDSDITAKNINTLKFTGKYSSIKALNSESVKIEELYDSNIELAKVGTFTCVQSKYDEIEFTSISKSINMMNAYSSTIVFGVAEPSFEKFSGEFKYGSVKLFLDPSLEFSLDFETTYGDVLFPKERFNLNGYKVNDSDSKHSFEASTSENPQCKINFSAYSTEFAFE
ncbi:MAG: DUF4097 family beta strand repeat-containing protein [Bacteroidales bacterium]|jgi:hypothetical protein|nr:DUF4097 family beta strand repeat-containing protein [Bacteroidales bacterium]